MTAALISATVALLIFAWTQWVTGLRSRHDLLRAKLEELCRSVVNLRGKIIQATQAHLSGKLDDQKAVLTQINQGIVDDLLTIQMLGSLYFPALWDRISRVVHPAEKVIGQREFFEGRNGELTSIQILVNSAAFQSVAVSTQELLTYVNLEYAPLTETPTARLSNLIKQIFG